jgi:hypothetical protein
MRRYIIYSPPSTVPVDNYVNIVSTTHVFFLRLIHTTFVQFKSKISPIPKLSSGSWRYRLIELSFFGEFHRISHPLVTESYDIVVLLWYCLSTDHRHFVWKIAWEDTLPIWELRCRGVGGG